MAEPIAERVCADAEDGVVVFLIGMRINRLWKIWKWLPVTMAMPRMLKQLVADPGRGLLSSRANLSGRNLWLVQYWKSAEHLRAFAHDAASTHLPAWLEFNQKIGTGGDVGIWHETYVVPPGHMEAIYVNMPRFGLGQAGTLHPAKGDYANATRRLARTKNTVP